jgi:hypothetical protein
MQVQLEFYGCSAAATVSTLALMATVGTKQGHIKHVSIVLVITLEKWQKRALPGRTVEVLEGVVTMIPVIMTKKFRTFQGIFMTFLG